MNEQPTPLSVFSIDQLTNSVGTSEFHQFVGTGLIDHRGQAGLSAIAVLGEVIGGITFYESQPPGTPTVQARVSLSAPSPVAVNSRLHGTGRVLGVSDGTASTFAEVKDERGTLVCAALGRSVVVGRPAAEMPHSVAYQSGTPRDRPPLPAPLPGGMSGADVARGLADGTVAMGPIHDLLALRIASIDGLALDVRAAPPHTMANRMGSLHGGVLMAIVAESCSLAAELSAAPGRWHRITDITLNYLRSPALDAGDLAIMVRSIKTGQRISSLSATVTDAGGTLLAHAIADAAAAPSRT
ncbi:MAG: hypothetical protein C0482_10100 [Gordonia sp.]|nr:hypothetical protein [Gordonia sp. (in: high G+C Gram-positive bacteria)]